LSEFDLIHDHFARLGSRRSDVSLGVGDDCALLRVSQETELAVSVDTLVSGVHFAADCDPDAVGHKSLAVGLSDLAAMGAEPVWTTLALTVPEANEPWLTAFSGGFARLALQQGVALVGGDTTRGPLTISVQVGGLVPAGKAVRRSGARPGDLVCVSGTLGDAGLALRRLEAGAPVSDFLRERLERPNPRVALGIALRSAARAMIDISDGLAADLGHLLEAGNVGAKIWLPSLPLSEEVKDCLSGGTDWELPLASGDDYELCFCMPAEKLDQIAMLAKRLKIRIEVVGQIRPGGGLRFLLEDGSTWFPARPGYDHFSDPG
jgi:thiamine-monophosphate kinase